ncbi:MAG: glycosyltransferase family 4 protein, partial [Candidatus Hydrogenedentes bacterium]|nr:glycosyltransferase family 4 protein [Candidatus Hydrogenedentota bacterium]
HLIVHTERSKRTLIIEGADSDKISVIDPGVDLPRFQPGPGDREALGLDEDAFVILFVGWLLPRKGLDFLLLALRELLSGSETVADKVQLLIVGSGPGRDRVESLARRLGITAHCHFIGSRPYETMPRLFQSADVFVLPSIATETWQEQFGMSLMESMACGTPVVTTCSGAIPEIVEDAALLCQPNDFLSLHDALSRLIADSQLEEACAEKGLEIARRRYDLDAYSRRLADVYARLATR